MLCWPHRSSPAAERVLASQIDSYEKLYEEVSKCDNTKVFNGWLQCDCRPFKQALLNTIKRWSLMFKRHLSNHVINRWAPGPLPRAHSHPHWPDADHTLESPVPGSPASRVWS